MMHARFNGKCCKCSGQIKAGEPIKHIGHKRNAHYACAMGEKKQDEQGNHGPIPPEETEVETEPSTSDFGQTWLTWDSYVDYVESLGESTKPGDSTNNGGGTQFTDYTSMSGAIKLAREGWFEGVKKIRELSAPMVDKVGSQIERQDPYFTIEPGQVDMGRYLDGEPECCLELANTMVSGPGKFVKIGINGLVSGGISPATIARRGAVVLALVELLEYSGCRVELDLLFYNSNHTNEVKRIDKIRLKSFEQPLEWSRLAYTAMHASSLRCLEFRVYECMDSGNRRLFNVGNHGGYGKVEPTKESVRKDYDVYFDGVHLSDGGKYDSLEACMATITGYLKEQGVTIG